MAAVVHSIAFAWITVQPRNSKYLPLLRLASLGSGVLTCGLLFGLLISNLWWCIVNLCIILVVIVEILRRWHQPIYEYLYHATNLVLASVKALTQAEAKVQAQDSKADDRATEAGDKAAASIAELLLHVYQSVCQLCIWIQQKFQSVCFEASQAFSLTHDAVEQENGRTRVAIV
uniref:Uncharacterized protein n=1 Tax=Quercus lobata TaxID=97700 RepID=A0A7N2LNE0_QUELO